MRNILVAFSLLLAAVPALSQVSGIIKDDQGKPLSAVSVAIKKVKDSAIVKIAATTADGKYQFAAIPAGTYFLSISHIGYADRNSAAFTVQGGGAITGPDVSMVKASKDLKEVVVTSKKPLVEVRADKMILNVEGSVNAVGQTALELLRKAPGVLVDKDDNLSLSGKNGVQVYIDGRPTPLSGADLAAYLKTIQSSEIEAIEIISNPSAKYDAAGNAGIINIRLKKNKSFGTNGSATAGYNLGTYPKYNGGLSLNNRDKKVNLFGNFNYNNSLNQTYISLYRQQLDTLFNQHSTIDQKNQSESFKVGMDYFINKRNTVGIMVNGLLSDNSTLTSSSTPISYIPNGKLSRTLFANNSSAGSRNNGNLNLNYHYTDSLGHDLSVDGDYGIYRITSDQVQPNLYYDPSGAFLYGHTYNMLSPTNIDIYSVKTDYEENAGKKGGRLGFGGKISYVTSGNNFQQYNVLTSSKQYDTLNSNNFDYKENINAAYLNYNTPLKGGWVLQIGARVENTNSTGTSHGYKAVGSSYVAYDSGFERHYTDLFPSAALTFAKNPMKQWTMTYSRRIDRPAYQDLNPFEFKLDEYTFQKGNTQLRPQYTNSFGLTYLYHYKLAMTMNYSHVSDVFTQLVDTVDRSKAFITKKNLATQDIVSLNVSYPFEYKWYSIFFNMNTYYSMYNANFGAGRMINLNVFAINFFEQQSFKLGKGWTGEISGFYTSPSIYQGTFQTQSIWSQDIGVQKVVLNKKGNVKVSVSDVFNTLHFTASSNFAGQTVVASGGSESRQLKLAFTYRFGNNQVKAARQRKTSSEDEAKRVNSAGGGIGGN